MQTSEAARRRRGQTSGRTCIHCGRTDEDDRQWSNVLLACARCHRQRLRRPCWLCAGPTWQLKGGASCPACFERPVVELEAMRSVATSREPRCRQCGRETWSHERAFCSQSCLNRSRVTGKTTDHFDRLRARVFGDLVLRYFAAKPSKRPAVLARYEAKRYDDRIDLAQALEEAIRDARLSTTQAAERIGFHKNALLRWVNDFGVPLKHFPKVQAFIEAL